MKKIIAVGFLLAAWAAHAQTYYTGWDNSTELAGWIKFRKGITSSSDWTQVSFNSVSAPNAIYHDYPVGSSGTDTTYDWYVSPAFTFASGGNIDSLKTIIYSITGSTTPVDYFGIYLLTGSNDPGLATTKTEIVDLTTTATTSLTWKDTGNFAIPPTAGTCYIAFCYRATNNWLTVELDNLKISGGIVSGYIHEPDFTGIRVYPVPVIDKICIHADTPQRLAETYLEVRDVAGKVLLRQPVPANGEIPHRLSYGSYFYRIQTEKGELVKEGKLLVTGW